MTIHIRQLEWNDHNSQRSFPLTVESSGLDVTGTFTIPDDFIYSISLGMPFATNTNPSKFLIRTLDNATTGFGIVLGYDNGSEVVNVATANIARAAHSEGQTYRLIGIGDYLDVTGHIVLGKLDNIDNEPAGRFTFDLTGARLEPITISPEIRGIPAIRVRNGADLSDRLTEDLVFEARTNMRLTVVQQAGQDTVIVFDAIDGEGTVDECVCEDDITTAPPIRTINNIPGTSSGDFTLLGNQCVKWETLSNGLRVTDNGCCSPCCGCTELEIVTSALEDLGDRVTTEEGVLTRLQAEVAGFNNALLGSRLNDQGCFSCDD